MVPLLALFYHDDSSDSYQIYCEMYFASRRIDRELLTY